MERLTLEQVRRLRFRAQGLDNDSPHADVAQVVRRLCGVQSQELPSSRLALRARSHGLTVADIRQAREEARSIALTWTLRGTMHLVVAEDLDWQLRVLGPLSICKTERRYKQLDLDEATRRKAADRMRDILSDQGPLTRAELADQLAKYGIPVAGQAIHHLVRYAALAGVICFGPERDGDLTYVLLDDWLGGVKQKSLTEEQIPGELARRYLQANGPATPHDLVSWAGIPVGQAKAGFEAIEADLVEVAIPSGSAWMLQDQMDHLESISEEPVVRLLPRYDTYLLGHQSRDFMVQDAFAKMIHPGGGLIRSAVVVGGMAVGVWSMKHNRNTATIIVESFERLDPAIMPQMDEEVQDIGWFLSLNMRLQINN